MTVGELSAIADRAGELADRTLSELKARATYPSAPPDIGSENWKEAQKNWEGYTKGQMLTYLVYEMFREQCK